LEFETGHSISVVNAEDFGGFRSFRSVNVDGTRWYHGWNVDVEIAKGVLGDATVCDGRGYVDVCLVYSIECETLLVTLVRRVVRRCRSTSSCCTACYAVFESLFSSLDIELVYATDTWYEKISHLQLTPTAIPLICRSHKLDITSSINWFWNTFAGSEFTNFTLGIYNFVVLKMSFNSIIWMILEVLHVAWHRLGRLLS